MTKEMLADFPKVECPFVRKEYKVNMDDWLKHGKELQLRTPTVYLATNEIAKGFEWVFEDKDTVFVEKLEGSNFCVEITDGVLTRVQNRLNPLINPLKIVKGKGFVIEGICASADKDYLKEGVQFGEMIGPKFQNNPYGMPSNLYYPFAQTRVSLSYNIFHKQEKSYDNWSGLFRYALRSRFYQKYHNVKMVEAVFAEGVIAYNQKLRDGKRSSYQAKLRRNMFPWYYSDKIEIYDLPDYMKEQP